MNSFQQLCSIEQIYQLSMVRFGTSAFAIFQQKLIEVKLNSVFEPPWYLFIYIFQCCHTQSWISMVLIIYLFERFWDNNQTIACRSTKCIKNDSLNFEKQFWKWIISHVWYYIIMFSCSRDFSFSIRLMILNKLWHFHNSGLV